MIESIFNVLKNDIWKKLNGEELRKRDFYTFVIYLLLDKNSFLIKHAKELSEKLEKIYGKEINSIDEYIIRENGDIIEIMDCMKNELKEKIEPILKEIENKNNSI